MDKQTERDYDYDSDNEINEEQHKKLLENVLGIGSRQLIKKPSRTESTLHISEFNLVKSTTGKKGSVRLSELTNVLKKKSQLDIGKKIKSAGKKAKTLHKPLDKPVAQRIKRTVAFQNVTKQLDRWDAVVTSNRAANLLKFPLSGDTKLDIKEATCGWRLKSDLEKRIEEIEPKLEVEKKLDSKFPLTLQEVIERRKEAAKLRAHQSYKEVQARRQNKIKSKKYHRIQRKEKLKQQLKDFETLQRTNPEEALQKLEEIERARAQERFSLRHKNTGQWAKNKQVRARYDKESRQALAEQLRISKQLTEKQLHESSDSEAENTVKEGVVSANSKGNPWVDSVKVSEEVGDFIDGYRKFWGEKGKDAAVAKKPEEQMPQDVSGSRETTKPNGKSNGTAQKEQDLALVDLEIEESSTQNRENEDKVKIIVQNKDRNITKKTTQHFDDTNKKKKVVIDNIKIQKITKQNKQIGKNENTVKLTNQNKNSQQQIKSEINKTLDKLNKRKVTCQASDTSMSAKRVKTVKSKQEKKLHPDVLNGPEWLVVTSDDEVDLDADFANLTNRLDEQITKKFQKLKKALGNEIKSQTKGKNPITKQSGKNFKKISLSFKKEVKRPIIDEELFEVTGTNLNSKKLTETLSVPSLPSDHQEKAVKLPENIDPNKFLGKPVELKTSLPTSLVVEDGDEDLNQNNAITEAFEDDDIEADFQNEKKQEVDKTAPKNINLSLPGWGEWAGKDLKVSKKKNRRFLTKFPKRLPRKDDKRKAAIINEKVTKEMKSHLVSELPFPFKKVEDFENSMKPPVGNTFVSETAFKELTRPPVLTKMGTVIAPMDEDILLERKK